MKTRRSPGVKKATHLRQLLLIAAVAGMTLYAVPASGYSTFPPEIYDLKASLLGYRWPFGDPQLFLLVGCSVGDQRCKLNSVSFRVRDRDSDSCTFTFYVYDKNDRLVYTEPDIPLCPLDGTMVSGLWWPTWDYPAGQYRFKVQARDAEGNLSRPVWSGWSTYV